DRPAKELTTGAALVHMILGGKPDPSQGYKYGYALCSLCKHIGEVPEHDSWCTIRNAAFQAVDAVLKKAGVSPKAFSTSRFLLDRAPPVAITKADDFPSIGHLNRQEVRQILKLLDPAKLEAAIESSKESEWLHSAISELRAWLETCAKTDRDLVCFYY